MQYKHESGNQNNTRHWLQVANNVPDLRARRSICIRLYRSEPDLIRVTDVVGGGSGDLLHWIRVAGQRDECECR